MFFSKGNRKLSSKQLIWSLPRGKTCIGAGECLKWCYEIKIERMYKNATDSRERNLEASKRESFVKEVVDYIERSKRRIVRIHESGDFYNQKYLNKWIRIATLLPEIIFYAFTKSFQLDFSKCPENLIIIQSYGSKFDNKINKKGNTSRVIQSLEELKKGEYLCPYHDKTKFTRCGECCDYCFNDRRPKHVAFLKH